MKMRDDTIVVMKGKRAQAGETRQRADGAYRKQGDGSWKKVSDRAGGGKKEAAAGRLFALLKQGEAEALAEAKQQVEATGVTLEQAMEQNVEHMLRDTFGLSSKDVYVSHDADGRKGQTAVTFYDGPKKFMGESVVPLKTLAAAAYAVYNAKDKKSALMKVLSHAAGTRKSMSSWTLDVMKGKKAQTGETRQRADGTYRKQGDGDWVKVSDKPGGGGGGGKDLSPEAHKKLADHHRKMYARASEHGDVEKEKFHWAQHVKHRDAAGGAHNKPAAVPAKASKGSKSWKPRGRAQQIIHKYGGRPAGRSSTFIGGKKYTFDDQKQATAAAHAISAAGKEAVGLGTTVEVSKAARPGEHNMGSLSDWVSDVMKGKKAQVGEVRERSDGAYVKTANGWKRVPGRRKKRTSPTYAQNEKSAAETRAVIDREASQRHSKGHRAHSALAWEAKKKAEGAKDESEKQHHENMAKFHHAKGEHHWHNLMAVGEQAAHDAGHRKGEGTSKLEGHKKDVAEWHGKMKERAKAALSHEGGKHLSAEDRKHLNSVSDTAEKSEDQSLTDWVSKAMR